MEETELSRILGLSRPSVEKVAEDPAPLTSFVTLKNIFKHPDAHPVALDLLLLKKYGHEFLVWEPETVQLFVEKSFGHVLSDLNAAKVQAMKALHLVDSFWEQWEVFLWCTMPFNSEFPDFEYMQVPTVAQCLLSVEISEHVRTDVPFSDEVKRYLETVYKHDGIGVAVPPTPLGVIPPLLEGVSEEGQIQKVDAVKKYLEEHRASLAAQLRMIEHA